MKKIAKRKPLDLPEQGFQTKIINFEPDNALDRINYSSIYHNCQDSGYQKLINHVASGDSESALELLENSGYSGIFADFLLDNADLDMRLQVLGDVLPCGGQDA
jgi:hypothetical protein